MEFIYFAFSFALMKAGLERNLFLVREIVDAKEEKKALITRRRGSGGGGGGVGDGGSVFAEMRVEKKN